MGEPIRTPDALDLQVGLDAATADLAARMSGKSAPPPATTPPPETPSTEIPPPEPASTEPPTPSTPATATEPGDPGAPGAPPASPAEPVPLSVQDPAAQRFLEMYGGDPDKAYAAAIRNNNRLAALAKAHPELFAEGAPGDPNAPPPEIPELFQEPALEPSVPVEDYIPDQNEISVAVNEWVDRDPQCRHLMYTFAQNDEQIRAKEAEISKMKGDVQYIQRKLEDEDFAPDDIRKADFRSELQNLRFELGIATQDKRALEDENRRMDDEFRLRRRQAWDSISESVEQRYAEEAVEREASLVEQQEYTKAQPEWLSAINRAIQTHHIPADQVKYFKADAKAEALASLSDPDYTIDNFDAFLTPIAKRTVERIDSSHRVKAAEYGAQAHVRATTPAPPSASGTFPPPASGPPDLDSIMEESTRMLNDRMRG